MQYRFEDYLLDPDRRELTRGSKAIAIGPQVFDLLVHLVQNRDHVVSKEGLLDEVWGGRIVSESTLTSHINAARKAIGDSGREQLLIRTVARKGFRFVGDVREVQSSGDFDSLKAQPAKSDEASSHALALPDMPSIAVLPFLNLSGDPEQEYFADGVVDDIISALSRIRWLFVVARNSSFTYKGRAVDVKQVGRELGVRYVLEGSVREAANRVRITGQLIDATTGGHLWSDRFEGTLGDIFDLQDQVTENVVGAIAPQLERAEIERAKQKPTKSLDAHDYYLRGMANLHRGTREAINEALAQFCHALQLDPNFASAYAMAAWCHFWRKVNGWMIDRPQEIAEGARLARRAVELGRDDAVALTRSGHALGHLAGDLDGGIALIDRALVLNPNLSAAWYLSGFQRISRGEPDDAIERFARAMRLSPLDPKMVRMQTGTAMAHLFAGRSMRRRHGRRKHRWNCQASCWRSASSRRAMRLPAEQTKRGAPCTICAGSIPRCAFPTSRIGSRSSDRKTSPRWRTVCEEQGYRSDGRTDDCSGLNPAVPRHPPTRLLPCINRTGRLRLPLPGGVVSRGWWKLVEAA